MANLLLEIGMEELPPGSVLTLCRHLSEAIAAGLEKAALRDSDAAEVSTYSTPRRLAVVIPDVKHRQPDRTEQRLGPAVAAAYKDGEPTQAARGFARSCGVEVDKLVTVTTDKGDRLGYEADIPGADASVVIPQIIEAAVGKLPIAKAMRWGDGRYSFVRPVHWLVLMLDETVVDLSLFGVKSGNLTSGHRIMGSSQVEIADPADYVETLRKEGVLADVKERRQTICDQVDALLPDGLRASIDDELLEEVTQLVEWPVALMGSFDENFLEVPDAILIASMQGHQKFFPVLTSSGLSNHFVAIANLASKSPDAVRAGFERVIAPRLADAKFFWTRDLQTPLSDLRNGLDKVVFQRKLGTIGDKTQRLTALAGWVGTQLPGVDSAAIEQAAQLSRVDLLTETVGEFPELQGTTGRRLAEAQGLDAAVAVALDEFYAPRFAGDSLPSGLEGSAVAIGDRLDTLVGIFAAGLIPKGNRDPFALRRAALGLYRILISLDVAIDLREGLERGTALLPTELAAGDDLVESVLAFIWDRARAMHATNGLDASVFEAVYAVQSRVPIDFERRLTACNQFRSRAEGASLAQANKRIVNLLKKSAGDEAIAQKSAVTLEGAEATLDTAIQDVDAEVRTLVKAGDYTEALNRLAGLEPAVNQFFEDVMVMSDDREERARRLSLVSRVRELFLQVADVSLLVVDAT